MGRWRRETRHPSSAAAIRAWTSLSAPIYSSLRDISIVSSHGRLYSTADAIERQSQSSDRLCQRKAPAREDGLYRHFSRVWWWLRQLLCAASSPELCGSRRHPTVCLAQTSSLRRRGTISVRVILECGTRRTNPSTPGAPNPSSRYATACAAPQRKPGCRSLPGKLAGNCHASRTLFKMPGGPECA